MLMPMATGGPSGWNWDFYRPAIDLALQDLIRRTGVTVDYRYKLDSIDL